MAKEEVGERHTIGGEHLNRESFVSKDPEERKKQINISQFLNFEFLQVFLKRSRKQNLLQKYIWSNLSWHFRIFNLISEHKMSLTIHKFSYIHVSEHLRKINSMKKILL